MNEKRTGLLALAGLVAMLGLNAAYKTRPERKDVEEASEDFLARAQWVGKLAPDFTLALMDGKSVSLASLVGQKVVVLNFWATWCAPCRAEMPELSRWLNANASQPVALFGIDADETPETVAGYLKEKPVPFPIGIDRGRAIERVYGVRSYPTTVVVGADARILLYETGAILNADVSLDGIVRMGIEGLKHGPAITKEAYLEKLKMEPASLAPRSAKKSEEKLEGRAKRIAEAMPCPCGCEHRVDACSCQTSARIKKKLQADGFGDKTDAAIMEDLNKEFCMKGMDS